MKRRPGFPLRMHLLLFGLICFFPAAIAVAYVGYDLARTEQARVEQQARSIVQEFSRSVDSELKAYTQALEALGTSPALQSGDYQRFREQAVIVARNNGSAIGLRRPDGQHVVNTVLPADTQPMPTTSDAVLREADRKAVESREPVVSDLYKGVAGQRFFVAIVLPVVIDGDVRYLLTMAIRPEQINDQLRLGALAQQGWLAAVAGTDGRVIARTRDLDKFVGMSATGDLARAMREKDSGTLASRTLDGVAVFSAFQRCAHGWTAVVSVPEAILRAPVDALIRFLALMIALVLAATVLGAYAYGRVLGDELAVLADNARRMGEHEKLRPFNWRIAEVATAQQAFAEAAEKAEHLLRELDHRVKNTLSVVQSIASRTVRNAGERAALYGRIGALNRAHDALSANRWSDVPMIPLLRSICDAEGVKVDMAGPDLSLKPRTATGLAQVWQELCANAKLHGALSCPEGRVVVHWTVQDKRVEFEWREPGHPAPSHYAPSFGLKVVELCIVRQLNGALRVDADPAGWTVRFGFPLQSALGVAGAVSSTA